MVQIEGGEVRNASLFSSAQSLFYRLRLEGQLAAAAKSDSRMRDELKKVGSDLKACDEERRKLLSNTKKLKDDVQSISKKRDTLSRMVNELDKEETGLQLDKDDKVKDMVIQVESLQGVLVGY